MGHKKGPLTHNNVNESKTIEIYVIPNTDRNVKDVTDGDPKLLLDKFHSHRKYRKTLEM